MPTGDHEQQLQVARAKEFLALHNAGELLVLPNAWDAGSAVIYQRAGFRAVATSSAGIAFSYGRSDGERVTLTDLLHVVKSMVARLSVPLSVDFETGYGDGLDDTLDSVRSVIRAGAVGINLEDGVVGEGAKGHKLVDLERQLELLRAVSGLREELGVPFVINARTDPYWLSIGSEAEQLKVSIERGNAFMAAGADCVFVPGNMGTGVISQLVREVGGPLNVILAPLTPSIAELNDLGVGRLTLGSGPARAAYALTRRIAGELATGSTDALSEFSTELGYWEANELFG